MSKFNQPKQLNYHYSMAKQVAGYKTVTSIQFTSNDCCHLLKESNLIFQFIFCLSVISNSSTCVTCAGEKVPDS